MPSGTRQESTHTVYVCVRAAPAAIGAGSGWLEVSVAQSTPSAPMTCVAKVTVPERTAVPPLFRKVTVTRSHQRRSPSASAGAETVRRAGPGTGGVVGAGVGVPVPGAGLEGAVGGVRGGVLPPGRGAALPVPEPPPGLLEPPELPEPSEPPPEPPVVELGAVPAPDPDPVAAPEPDPDPCPVPVPVTDPDPGPEPVPGPVPPGAGEGGAGGEGEDVLEVSPVVVGPSKGTRVTAPDGVAAPPGEGPAPTAAYPSPSPPPPQAVTAVSAPPRQSATATSPGFLRLMTPSLADDPSAREPFGEVSPR